MYTWIPLRSNAQKICSYSWSTEVDNMHNKIICPWNIAFWSKICVFKFYKLIKFICFCMFGSLSGYDITNDN